MSVQIYIDKPVCRKSECLVATWQTHYREKKALPALVSDSAGQWKWCYRVSVWRADSYLTAELQSSTQLITENMFHDQSKDWDQTQVRQPWHCAVYFRMDELNLKSPSLPNRKQVFVLKIYPECIELIQKRFKSLQEPEADYWHCELKDPQGQKHRSEVFV